MEEMKDRLGNPVQIGDTVFVACLSRKRAHLRSAVVKDIVMVMGVPLAKLHTEAGGNTTAQENNMIVARNTNDTRSA